MLSYLVRSYISSHIIDLRGTQQRNPPYVHEILYALEL
jgi:hypothetical protein